MPNFTVISPGDRKNFIVCTCNNKIPKNNKNTVIANRDIKTGILADGSDNIESVEFKIFTCDSCGEEYGLKTRQ